MNNQEIEAQVAVAAGEVMGSKRVPLATYRLQFNPVFTFPDAARIVAYLRELGISDCYASPPFKARPGSTHGYDVCDHSQLNPELGGQEGFIALASALRESSMGLVLDMVPNHMAIADCNTRWLDVLENGRSSAYASYFDIDWHPVKPELENKVLLPILEDQYGKVLESGKLRLGYEEGAFLIRYYDQKLPIAPKTYSQILSHALTLLREDLPGDNSYLQELESILTALGYLPSRLEMRPERIAERFREKEIIKRRIANLRNECSQAAWALDEAVKTFNGEPGNPRSFDLLDGLIEAQSYRASFWRVSGDEINYRRFFDINDLAAIRVEHPSVFQATHHLVFRLLDEGWVTGLRIDHPDGLWDPPSYFRQLQQDYLVGQLRGRWEAGTATDTALEAAVAGWYRTWLGTRGLSARPRPLYLVVEKILSEGETLPDDWAVDGTTGYDFLKALNELFVDSVNLQAFDTLYTRFIGTEIDFRNLVNSTKKSVMLVALGSEIQVLGHHLNRLSEKNRWYKDFTLISLTFALREVIAALPVYRTYITGPDTVTERDRRYIEAAVAEARKRNPRTARAVFDFVQESLLLRNVAHFREEDRQGLIEFVMKFQQLTGPTMARGVEDTAFYVYNRLVSLNEVGGNPARFGSSLSLFHHQNLERSRSWPHSLLATSTHDTKRGEDVRARISVLSEIPNEWREALESWRRLNAPGKVVLGGEEAPSPNDEYLLYQTLIGVWPDHDFRDRGEAYSTFRDRIVAYMLKAIREAKVHTSWINPNEDYDTAVQGFVRGLLDDTVENPFLQDFRAFQKRVAFYGRFNALSQVLLKILSPGVPDIYQGTELWDLSLVDPDNRRPVDYELRRCLLDDLKRQVQSAARAGRRAPLAALARELTESISDGRIKLYLTWRALRFRSAHRQLFTHGGYFPLEAEGDKKEHVCAFARLLDDQVAIVAVPRLLVRLTRGVEKPPWRAAVWKDTWLPLVAEFRDRTFRNIFTGAVVRPTERQGVPTLQLATMLKDFPVALLEQLQT